MLACIDGVISGSTVLAVIHMGLTDFHITDWIKDRDLDVSVPTAPVSDLVYDYLCAHDDYQPVTILKAKDNVY